MCVYGCVDGGGGDSWLNADDAASSAAASSSAAIQVTNPGALYAVVSRSRTAAPSQTNPITTSSRSSWAAGSTLPSGDAGVDTRQDLYTRVIRRQEGRRTSPSAAQSLMIEPGAGVGLSGYGYARIDDSLPQQNYGNTTVDFYDVIRDDLSATASSDFDPNYESVPQTTVPATVSSTSGYVNGVAGTSGTTVSQQQHGSVVAAAVVNDSGSLRQNDAARRRGLLIREHIYDEVSSPTTATTTTITTTTTTTTTTTCTMSVTHTDV